MLQVLFDRMFGNAENTSNFFVLLPTRQEG
jgi:hypothetical protein